MMLTAYDPGAKDDVSISETPEETDADATSDPVIDRTSTDAFDPSSMKMRSGEPAAIG